MGKDWLKAIGAEEEDSEDGAGGFQEETPKKKKKKRGRDEDEDDGGRKKKKNKKMMKLIDLSCSTRIRMAEYYLSHSTNSQVGRSYPIIMRLSGNRSILPRFRRELKSSAMRI